jgi:signal transduction histidine kinase
MRLVNLAEYLNEVLATLGPSLKNKPVSVRVDCQPGLCAHTFPGALAQVITNLVMNSVIHGFEGKAHGVVNITVSAETENLHLRFEDDGNGMEPDALNKLFDPFYTTKRGAGGSGLGANIVYNLITGPLAGRIEASSPPGRGLQYAIRMPLDLRGTISPSGG